MGGGDSGSGGNARQVLFIKMRSSLKFSLMRQKHSESKQSRASTHTHTGPAHIGHVAQANAVCWRRRKKVIIHLINTDKFIRFNNVSSPD